MAWFGLEICLSTASVTSGVQKVLDLLIAPVFDTAMEIAGGVLNGVTEFAQNIWQWGKPIRDVLGKAWDWVLGKLGIGGDGEGGILNWVKEKAATIWTEIQERFAPVIEPMRKVVGVVIAFSPVGLLMGAVKFAPQIIEAIQWLWENKDNPNIVKDAHEEMGHTILPKLLSGAEGLSNGFQSVVEPFTTQLAQIGESLLGLMSAVSGVPLLNGATEFFQSISENVENLKKASVEKFQSAVESTKQFSQKVQEKLAPYAEVLSSLGVALVNPAMIPMILAGNAWLALPDCYQGAIIDVILDALIAILSTASEIPAFGPLWSLLQTGILGFLEGLRGQATDIKVQISQKIAKIISGRSLDFILGFVKGVLKGIWEGLSDPFVLMYQGVKAIGSLMSWIGGLTSQPKQSEGRSGASSSPAVANPATAAGSPSQESSEVDREDISQSLTSMGTELETPAGVVQENFMSGAQDAFSAGEGLTYAGLVEKLGSLWASIEEQIRNAGSQIAQGVCDFLMGDGSEGQMGESVGWLAGTIAFEVVLAILTAGSVTAAKGAMKVVKIVAKVLDWTGEALGVAFKMLSKVGGYVIDIAKGLGKLVGNASGGAAKLVMESVQQIGDILLRYADELLGKLGKGAVGEAAETAGNRGAREAAGEGVEASAEKAAKETSVPAGQKGHYDEPEIEPGIVAKRPVEGGKHHLKITKDGRLIRCSRCTELEKEYEFILAKNPELKTELDRVKKLSKNQKEIEAEKVISHRNKR
ncbi:hypothetical protein [Baaleninema simplex]|uniref:hypothetical protein n=1 Tax=Baaleninema simplex TaxID=2862350 RepID=UPI00037EA4EB|nr:hypothetical protein [Baaleninema simplex]